MGASNADVVKQSFAGQAAAFEDPTRAFASTDVAGWMRENSRVSSGDLVLEVAAGTGLFGRSLSPAVAAVVAVDITSEMLAAGKSGADAAGLTNIVFQRGDATALSFLDASFDRVISRLAIHHFDDPLTVLREMVRVCRPSGSIVVIDMVVPAAADQTTFDDLERRRDPAHTRALTRDELRSAIEDAGCEIVHGSTWENVLDGERWMEQTRTAPADTEVIRGAWSAELAGGPRTGMDPRLVDGRVQLVHYWDLHVGALSP
jgi:SAM-dependent methyltransferase